MYLMVCSETQGGRVVMFAALPAAAELSTCLLPSHTIRIYRTTTPPRLQGYGEIQSRVWMSHQHVECEHTRVDTIKSQPNTSNHTTPMEKTAVSAAQGRIMKRGIVTFPSVF